MHLKTFDDLIFSESDRQTGRASAASERASEKERRERERERERERRCRHEHNYILNTLNSFVPERENDGLY